MKFKVISMSEHRIDVMMADWIKKALLLVGETIVEDAYDVLIVTNGFLNPKVVEEMHNAPLAIYMWDDYDLPVPDEVKVISQAKDLWDRPFEQTVYFPISKLACMSNLWLCPYTSKKKFNLVYGGSYKEIRAEQYDQHILNNPSTLLIGSDTQWDRFDKVTRLNTIKDMDILYNVMSMAVYTIILEDPKHNGNSIPLRYYESIFSDLSIIPVSDKVFGNLKITRRLDRRKVAQNLKEVIWKLI